MSSVYVVTKGEYSDFCIVGIFSTRELAEAAAALVAKSDPGYSVVNDIEEWMVDCGVGAIRRGCLLWKVRMWKDGSAEAWLTDINSDPTEPSAADESHRWFEFCCEARSKEHAIKIANDRRAQMIAAGW